MNSYCVKVNSANLIYYSNYTSCLNKTILYLNKIIETFNQKLGERKFLIINLPFNDYPVTHKPANTIITYAHDVMQFIYQVSHELTHLYIGKVFNDELMWIEELIASSMSLHICKYLESDYEDYLNSFVYPSIELMDDELFQSSLKPLLNNLTTNPSLIYSNNQSFAFHLRNYDLFKVIKDLKSETNLYKISDINNFDSSCMSSCICEETKKFLNLISVS